MSVRDVQPGDKLFVYDAFGKWHHAIADSVVEGTHHGGGRKVHDFPVVWVRIDGGDRIPWPAESMMANNQDRPFVRDDFAWLDPAAKDANRE